MPASHGCSHRRSIGLYGCWDARPPKQQTNKRVQTMSYVIGVVRLILTGIVALLLVLLLVALEGCTVGPKYAKPTVPTSASYKEETPASFKESDQWQPAHPGDQTSRGKWWEIFGDPELNQLEEAGVSSL